MFRRTHSTSMTIRGLFSTMTLLITLLMATLDLAGFIFDLRMLRSCFKDKTKYTFLQKCRTLAICQCACQVIILLADAVEWWKGLETEPRESCNVFRVSNPAVTSVKSASLTGSVPSYGLQTHYVLKFAIRGENGHIKRSVI